MSNLIPTTRALAHDLPSDVLYAFERAGEISREILDERVTAWAEAGLTQQWMADEMGCSQPAVSKRMKRLGLAPAHPEKQRLHNRVMQGSNGGGTAPEIRTFEIADVEIFDPGTEAICPACHGTGVVPVESLGGVVK